MVLVQSLVPHDEHHIIKIKVSPSAHVVPFFVSFKFHFMHKNMHVDAVRRSVYTKFKWIVKIVTQQDNSMFCTTARQWLLFSNNRFYSPRPCFLEQDKRNCFQNILSSVVFNFLLSIRFFFSFLSICTRLPIFMCVCWVRFVSIVIFFGCDFKRKFVSLQAFHKIKKQTEIITTSANSINFNSTYQHDK